MSLIVCKTTYPQLPMESPFPDVGLAFVLEPGYPFARRLQRVRIIPCASYPPWKKLAIFSNGELLALSVPDQTRFATAVSEISRNCIEHAKKGSISFKIKKEEDNNLLLNAEISDSGPGIQDLDVILGKREIDARYKGVGILSSRKLVDHFHIDTCDTGTCVILQKKIPKNHPPINNLILEGWRKHFAKDAAVSPYEEIKNRNIQLLKVADQLKTKVLQADMQMEEIQKLNDILESKNENLKQIAYTIAHDLKNPINSIKLSCQMAATSEIPIAAQRFLEIIETNSDRLVGIIEGLQKTIDHDPDIELSADQVNLPAVLEELKIQFARYLEKVSGTLISDCEVDELYYPEVYVFSILSNLISNAIKYSADRPLIINVSAKRKGDYFELTVADNGIGIDLDKHQAKMFKAFNRFSQKGEGKGMGLSIVSYMITRNGGKIEVESTPGKGTTFCCYLKEYNKKGVF